MKSADDIEPSSNDRNLRMKASSDVTKPKSTVRRTDSIQCPPLPLIIFRGVGVRSEGVKTIDGKIIRSIPNQLSPSKKRGDFLQDISHARRLEKWFTARSKKEAAVRHSKLDRTKRGASACADKYTVENVPVFESTAFEADSESTLKNEDDNREMMKSLLLFDSNFESGNLLKALLVKGRENLVSGYTLKKLQSDPGSYVTPGIVDQEYDLTIRNDLNTSGNIQWYYFSASTEHILGKNSEGVFYPLRVRFNIVNFRKKDALYNYGMKPATFISNNTAQDWIHRGQDICYYKRCRLSTADMSNNDENKRKEKYILSYTYTFSGPMTVYFAHSYPYTYTDLKKYLASLEEDSRIAAIMSRKELCTTIAGNVCECVTVTSRTVERSGSILKPAIVISARVHPGETNSSYMMHGVIDFLISECAEARILRDTFIFKLIPMLNPDGVIHGNYRCSLIGTDLNRRYLHANPMLYPTIAAMKNLLGETHRKRGVLLFLDLHGHSKKKNAFLYGSDCTLQSPKLSAAAINLHSAADITAKKIFARSFARVLCSLSDVKKGGYFSYKDCTYTVGSGKAGSGRVVSWRELGIIGAYTIEASFCGSGNNNEKSILKQHDAYKLAQSNNSKEVLQEERTMQLSESSEHIADQNTDNSTSNLNTVTTQRSMNRSDSGVTVTSSRNSPAKPDKINSVTVSTAKDTCTKIRRGSLNFKKGRSRHRNTGDIPYDELMRDYETAVHYTKGDMRNIGRDIMKGIFNFANLGDFPDESGAPLSRAEKASQQRDRDISVSTPIGTDPPPRENIESVAKNTIHCESSSDTFLSSSSTEVSVQLLGSEMVTQPLLRASVYTTDAIKNAYMTFPSEFTRSRESTFPRLKSEILIRKQLKLDCPAFSIVYPTALLASSTIAAADDHDVNGDDNGDEMDFECEGQKEGADGGSDSEPSVDNMPPSSLFGRKNLSSLKDCKSILKELRCATAKRRATSEKVASREERKSSRERPQSVDVPMTARAAVSTAAAREALSQPRNQKAAIKTAISLSLLRSPLPEFVRQVKVNVLHFDDHTLDLNSANLSLSSKWALGRVRMDTGHVGADSQCTGFLPKMHSMFGKEKEKKCVTGTDGACKGDRRGPPSMDTKPSRFMNHSKGNGNPFLFRVRENSSPLRLHRTKSGSVDRSPQPSPFSLPKASERQYDSRLTSHS